MAKKYLILAKQNFPEYGNLIMEVWAMFELSFGLLILIIIAAILLGLLGFSLLAARIIR
jgi:hypothetical protein